MPVSGWLATPHCAHAVIRRDKNKDMEPLQLLTISALVVCMRQVWKGTTELGCGYSACGGSPLYVCNYNPAGNYVGQVQQNVFPPRS